MSKKAWWLTEKGASLQRYSSFFDEDAGVAYGLGCGGTVILLLERGAAAKAVLEALRFSMRERRPAAVITEVNEASPGTRLVVNSAGDVLYAAPEWSGADRAELERLGHEALWGGSKNCLLQRECEADVPLFCERIVPPPALWIFGAGDDVQPLVEFAYDLGWHVTVADGRTHLARAERFPHAHRVVAIASENFADVMREIGPGDAVVLMTHSYEQDRMLLARLLPRPPAYLGVLGPRSRTMHILKQLTKPEGGELDMTVDEAAARLYSPVGLDISAHSPAAIALSIAAEVQAVLATRPSGADRQTERTAESLSSHASC